jgi:flagellar basal-body rod protein FlgB
MGQINLFAVASQQAQWLSVRQSAIAQNVVNANTPGYQAVDVTPFERVLEQAKFDANAGADGVPRAALQAGKSVEVKPSGNSVSLEQELIKADEVNRAYALNTSIVKSFHRMLMMSVK